LKKGVQLTLLSERIKHYHGEVAIRHLQGVAIKDDVQAMQTLLQLRKELANRPYEQHTLELLRATIDNFGSLCRNKADLSSIFCSELVAEAYQRLNLLAKIEPANEYIPKDFSAMGKLSLLRGAYLGPEITIKTSVVRQKEVALAAVAVV
jgi:hypothetical protein